MISLRIIPCFLKCFEITMDSSFGCRNFSKTAPLILQISKISENSNGAIITK